MDSHDRRHIDKERNVNLEDNFDPLSHTHEVVLRTRHGSKKFSFVVRDGATGPTGCSSLLPSEIGSFGDYLHWNYDKWTIGNNEILLGSNAGLTGQGSKSIAIGCNAGKEEQKCHSVAIGAHAAEIKQGKYAAAIGFCAGNRCQKEGTIAIGYNAGASMQSTQSTAIGFYAGTQKQGINSVSLGPFSGTIEQGDASVAIGFQSGYSFQKPETVAIGCCAGNDAQMSGAIAIGYEAGNNNQGPYSVAVGYKAGNNNQGANSIAIGPYAGLTNQIAHSIYLNASGTGPTENGYQINSGFYVNPIRNAAGANMLFYDPTNNEITYETSTQHSKANIKEVDLAHFTILDLKAKSFSYKNDPQTKEQIGYIAEDVANVMPQLATYTANGEISNINWRTFSVLLLEEVKRLSKRVSHLEEQLRN